MASEKRRARRRASRRKAHLRSPSTKFRVITERNQVDDSLKYTWLLLFNAKERVGEYDEVRLVGCFRFKHSNLSIRELAQEGILMDDPPGLFWAAMRIFYPNPLLKHYRRGRGIRGRDKYWLSDNLCKFLNRLDEARDRRKNQAKELEQSQMVQFKESFGYRMDLLKARRSYHIDKKARALQEKMIQRGEMTEDGRFSTSADDPFFLNVFGWDYRFDY